MPVEKNTAQSAGSALTYARRYSLSAAFGISSDVDDDGNADSGNSSDKKPYAKQKQSKPAPITKVQISEIKDKAHRLAEKNASEVGIVYEGLNITDVSSLTKVYADECIATLNNWLGGE